MPCLKLSAPAQTGGEDAIVRYAARTVTAAFVGVSLAAIMAGLVASTAQADPVADFYKGKQIQFVVRSAAGGSYDLYSRLLARHMSKHIPGNPQLVPINMPGSGGIKAAMYMANVAPKDGTVISIFSQGLIVDQALGVNKSFTADLAAMNWIGNVSYANQALWAWHQSKSKSFKDMQTRETVIGTTGAGSISVQLPALYNNLLGTKLKIVFGYLAGTQVDLAMERGEVEGRGTETYPGYFSSKPDWVKNKMVVPVIQVGLKKDAAMPDVPLLREQAKRPEDQAILDFMSQAVAFGRPIGTTPGVPEDRVKALREAFDKTLADPDFIADAEKQRMDLLPMNGAELTQIVHAVLGAPQDLRARVKVAIEPRTSDAVKAEGQSGGSGE
jgi:tripartite-type tricarboxylate transporter receptor subunit TctC